MNYSMHYNKMMKISKLIMSNSSPSGLFYNTSYLINTIHTNCMYDQRIIVLS